MERRLSESDYLAGADYSIADIAAFPWANVGRWNMAEMLGLADTVATKPALQAWLDAQKAAKVRYADAPKAAKAGK